ncbi:eIF4G, partial [Aphelenchoides avenae]
AKEDGKIDDKSATSNVVGDESAQESSEELVRKMEEHLARFHDNPVNLDANVQAEFDANVYSRDFLYALRNIVCELKLEKPAMPHSLDEVGLDRRGMPDPQTMCAYVRRYVDRGGDKFTPSWQPRAQDSMRNMLHPRVPYAGRHNDKRQRQKKGPVGRPSMDRLPRQADLLKRSENAWIPPTKVRKRDSTEQTVDPEKLRIEDRTNKTRALLNKITPSTFAELWAEFMALQVHEDEQFLSRVVDMIFERAIMEPMYAPLYSDLCKNEGIFKKAQATFENAYRMKETIKQVGEELEAETDKEKKQEKASHLEALRTKEKRRLQGAIRFIAELYRHFLITDTIIQWCSVHLIKTYEETKEDVYIEYATHMIERVGPSFEARKMHRVQAPNAPSFDLIEVVMTHFMQIKDTLSNRVRLMILNLDELRQAGWKSKRFAGEQGPKTIQEVHQEAKDEEIQNRVERGASRY